MITKKRCLIVEEYDVTIVLNVINHHQGFFTDTKKRVGNCGWAEELTKWYIQFYASDKEWGRIAVDLNRFGKISIHVNPAGTAELYYMRN